MRFSSTILLFFLTTNVGVAQQDLHDPGQADTISLVVESVTLDGPKATIIVQAWVYSDNPVQTFSAGFKWSGSSMHLDSVKRSALLSARDIATFFYYKDDYDISNDSQIFVLGGFSFQDGIDGYSYSRRLWATYYFTVSNWNPDDSILIDSVSANLVEYQFVTGDTSYALGYKPIFSGPVKISGIPTSINNIDSPLPENFVLLQNYPNPFNPITTIEFQIPTRSNVLLEIFNIGGQNVQTLVNQLLSAGSYRIIWDSRLSDNSLAPSGIYFYRLSAGEYQASEKMVLLK